MFTRKVTQVYLITLTVAGIVHAVLLSWFRTTFKWSTNIDENYLHVCFCCCGRLKYLQLSVKHA